MSFLVICGVALAASALTFFSGFGLGTLLLPAAALFFPIEQAVAMTAVVHLLNGIFKFALTWRHLDRGVVVRFGLPAIAASLAGAWLLVRLAGVASWGSYPAFGRVVEVTPVKVVVGGLLAVFSIAEVVPGKVSFSARFLPLGGVLSGFFGGLSGMQGAFRSAFLSRAGLGKEAFIGSGAAIACLVDLSRLTVYLDSLRTQGGNLDPALLAAAVAAAWAGAAAGNAWLPKVTMPWIQRIVAAMVAVVALGLISGIL